MQETNLGLLEGTLETLEGGVDVVQGRESSSQHPQTHRLTVGSSIPAEIKLHEQGERAPSWRIREAVAIAGRLSAAHKTCIAILSYSLDIKNTAKKIKPLSFRCVDLEQNAISVCSCADWSPTQLLQNRNSQIHQAN